MKQSKWSGKFIFNAISKVKKELDEITQACEVVVDEIGVESVAYKILKQNREEKQRELMSLENKTYTEDSFTKEKELF